MRDIPRPYEIYKHFKGNYYQVLTIATHSETKQQMVVYQQLYSPFGVYVRPLDMFVSKVDREKYPDVEQEYRFERIMVSAHTPASDKQTEKMENTASIIQTGEKPEAEPYDRNQLTPEEETIDPLLLEFLEADSYEAKLRILTALHPRITDDMINTMMVVLDVEVAEGDIEVRYSEIMNCLLTMKKYECDRLR